MPPEPVAWRQSQGARDPVRGLCRQLDPWSMSALVKRGDAPCVRHIGRVGRRSTSPSRIRPIPRSPAPGSIQLWSLAPPAGPHNPREMGTLRALRPHDPAPSGAAGGEWSRAGSAPARTVLPKAPKPPATAPVLWCRRAQGTTSAHGQGPLDPGGCPGCLRTYPGCLRTRRTSPTDDA